MRLPVLLWLLGGFASEARANSVEVVSFSGLVEPSTGSPSDKDGYPPTSGSADPEEAMLAARLVVTSSLDAPAATLVDLDVDAVDDLSVDGDNPRALDLLDGFADAKLAPGIYALYWNLEKTGYKTNLPASSAGNSLQGDIEQYRIDVSHATGSFSSPSWTVLCEGSASINQNDLALSEYAGPASPPVLGDVFHVRAKYEQSSAGGMDFLTAQLYFEGSVLRVESLALYYYDSDGVDPGSVVPGVPPGFARSWPEQPSLGPADLPATLSSGDHWVVEIRLRVWAPGASWLHPYFQTRPAASANWKVDSGYGERFDEPCLIDADPPTIICPPDLELECPAAATEIDAWRNAATATDNCAAQLSSALVDHQPGCGGSYIDTYRFTAKDDAGNEATCEARVVVEDSSQPTLSGVPADTTVECDAVPPAASPAVSDSCDPDPTLLASETRIDGTCPDAYQLVRVWTATDACGNSVSASQTLTVRDRTPPALVAPPDDRVECDAVPTAAMLVATDNCDPDPVVTFSETRIDGGCAGEYTLVRTWTATDRCGNQASVTQTLEVVDTTPPVVQPGSANLACLWPPNHWYLCLRPEDLAPVVSDNCSEPVTWRLVGCASDQPDDAPEDGWNGDGHTRNDCVVLADGQICVRSERAGTGPGATAGRHYAVAVTASDACGNESDPVMIGYLHVPHDQSPRARDCLDPTRVGCRPNQDIPCRGR